LGSYTDIWGSNGVTHVIGTVMISKKNGVR
jgi:hypothetical protein